MMKMQRRVCKVARLCFVLVAATDIILASGSRMAAGQSLANTVRTSRYHYVASVPGNTRQGIFDTVVVEVRAVRRDGSKRAFAVVANNKCQLLTQPPDAIWRGAPSTTIEILVEDTIPSSVLHPGAIVVLSWWGNKLGDIPRTGARYLAKGDAATRRSYLHPVCD